MRLYTAPRKVSSEVPMSFFRFDRFEKRCGDFVLIDARINFRSLAELKKTGEKIVYFEIEEPNRFASPDPDFRREEYEGDFYKLLCVCPYTTEWLNKVQGAERRRFVFFPFDTEIFPAAPVPKRYDVIYFGALNGREIYRIVKTISRFNYRFVGPSEEKGYKILQTSRLAHKIKKILHLPNNLQRYLTDKNITNAEKLRLISETKVTVVHNLLFYNARNVRCIQRVPGFKDNGAFALIPDKNIFRTIWDFVTCKEYIVPQQKTRLFEAALCRSLILCRKDQFNMVERFFTPDKEFVYYEEGKLAEKLAEVLAHYDDYASVIEAAYKRASREYTTEVFFERYLKDLN